MSKAIDLISPDSSKKQQVFVIAFGLLYSVRFAEVIMTALRRLKILLLFAALLLLISGGSFVFAASEKDKASKAQSPSLGYVNHTAVSCKWAKHCREDLTAVEGPYMKYLDEGEAQLHAALADGAGAELLQEKVQDYRAGLQAREFLYGRCPGKCLSYDFPAEFRNASRLVSRKARVEFLVDLASVYYGAEHVLKGQDLSEPILVELKKTAR